MYKYIKVKKELIDNGSISAKIGDFANIIKLNLDKDDYIEDRTVVHLVGEYYYILNALFDKANKGRQSESSDEEIAMIQKFIDDNNLETITMNEMDVLLNSEVEL